MNSNTNHKINQVSEDTMVIGIDIAKKKHFACAMDDRGRILQKSFPFFQSGAGFDQLDKRIQSLQIQHQKSEVIVGFEPTGHYWMNLAAYLVGQRIRFVMVNPMHVNRTKELDDNLQTKNDQKDARVIASLIRDGRFNYTRTLEGVEAELRNGASLRSKIQEDLTAIKNRMVRWTDLYFPEFHHIFKSFGKNACAVLEMTPLPIDLYRKSDEDLIYLYKSVEGLQCLSFSKIKKLKSMAKQSIGLTEGLEMARFEMGTLISQFKALSKQLETLSSRLNELAQQMTDYEFVLSVDGLGENTVVELLSETGSLSLYEHPRQLIKLAGLTLRENSSGQHKGQKKISKRGRRKLRAILFRVILPLIQHNIAFKSLYHYYTTRTVNPLKKKEAMVVLCGKLLKILHALCVKRMHFNASLMMRDLHCLQEAA
ncbi:IS110 family transposase [Bacillus sp. SG-1]|uniref:IS110 family transposase n=1 Tax=Bacillus sp. SG-1 TaxID=161544 RepID=UPI0001544097|nr:IS110 family transposase [Bacillus sp. SG-1]EDL66430.1 transposase [Bacillus sp. SG-1]